MARITVLNPMSDPPDPPAGVGRRLPRLEGRTVAFLSNNKPNADALLGRVARELESRCGIHARRFIKEVPSLEAPGELLGACAEEAHAVVLAAYD